MHYRDGRMSYLNVAYALLETDVNFAYAPLQSYVFRNIYLLKFILYIISKNICWPSKKEENQDAGHEKWLDTPRRMAG